MIRYGFQRMALLGSAGYRRAELPLDASVSLIAPNTPVSATSLTGYSGGGKKMIEQYEAGGDPVSLWWNFWW